MDCTNARLLLNFVRTGELEPAERDVLEKHLAACPECCAAAQAQVRFDEALETAMPRVPIPAGLKGRILHHLVLTRPRNPWPWAVAAAVLLAVGLGTYLALTNGPVAFDPSSFKEFVDFRAVSSADSVEAQFLSELGIAMKAPREFNFNLLDSYETAEIQGRRVPKLTFLARGGLAHVYVFSTDQFMLPVKLEDEAAKKDGWMSEIIPASRHTIQLRSYPSIAGFFYVAVYTTDSLDPFTFQGI